MAKSKKPTYSEQEKLNSEQKVLIAELVTKLIQVNKIIKEVENECREKTDLIYFMAKKVADFELNNGISQ